ncbi:hypothetical protein L1987_45429 [Smallanthus sonchifolius]|uniref:Uncharacterized protein n=1 Tax=Smallanthus sonchifolius TaxID=185202 RepID=A0ACB9FX21_9ASTR|nr:hypothetical protein L1987_45429 [Smallanthus sonchifolius]
MDSRYGSIYRPRSVDLACFDSAVNETKSCGFADGGNMIYDDCSISIFPWLSGFKVTFHAPHNKEKHPEPHRKPLDIIMDSRYGTCGVHSDG